MRTLKTKILPSIVMRLLGAFAWSASYYLTTLALSLPFSKSFAAVLAAIGLALNVLPKPAFGRARTTVNPLWPSSTTYLVTSVAAPSNPAPRN